MLVMVAGCQKDEAGEQTDWNGPTPLVPETAVGFRAHQFSHIVAEEPVMPPENRLRAKGPARIITPAELEEIRNQPPSPPPMEDETVAWTDAQWIAAMRPVVFRDGVEYELAESDGQYLARLQRAKRYQMPSPPIESSAIGAGPTPVPVGGLNVQAIIGEDNRTALGGLALTNVELKPIGVMNSLSAGGVHGTSSPAPIPEGSCTLTVVGPSTAVTAAHCYYWSGYGWFSTREWAFGAFNPGPAVGPRQFLYGYASCYTVVVPNGWVTDGLHNVNFDFAVVEFSGCGLTPGNTLGWYGYYEPTNAQIASNAPRVIGYPGNLPPGSGPMQWPTIVQGASGVGGAWVETTTNTTAVFFSVDVTGGQSGALVTQSFGWPWGIAVVKGGAPFYPPLRNWGRRIDSTVTSFWAANSAL